jgi:hypothetical protein
MSGQRAGATQSGIRRCAVLAAAIAVSLFGCAHGSTLTYVNRTTVAVAVVDHGSRTIVGPCSERVIAWSNTWGGDPVSGVPRSEPLPSDAVSVSVEDIRPASDGTLVLTILVSKDQSGVIVNPGSPDPRSLPCEGRPPSPSPAPS